MSSPISRSVAWTSSIPAWSWCPSGGPTHLARARWPARSTGTAASRGSRNGCGETAAPQVGDPVGFARLRDGWGDGCDKAGGGAGAGGNRYDQTASGPHVRLHARWQEQFRRGPGNGGKGAEKLGDRTHRGQGEPGVFGPGGPVSGG